MEDIENKYYQVAWDGNDSLPESVTSRRWLKVGAALIGGSCVMILSCMTSSVSSIALPSTRAAESTSLISPSLRMNTWQRTGAAMVTPGVLSQGLSTHDTSIGALKKYAMKQIEANIRSNQMRDISMKATEREKNQATHNAAEQAKAELEKLEEAVKSKAQDMTSVRAPPLGFFEPIGFSTDCSTGRLLFFREVELKHGRVGMLASLGLLVAEQFHPLFGGGIDVPSYIAFQQTPLQKFWWAVLLAVSIPEVFSVSSFESPFHVDQIWRIKDDHEPGNLGFDPLGLKPKNPAELKDIQTTELNNGRLAMIAAAGMIAQEMATGHKLF